MQEKLENIYFSIQVKKSSFVKICIMPKSKKRSNQINQIFCLVNILDVWDFMIIFLYTAQSPAQTRLPHRTLGSFVNFGLEIQNWESTTSLISKVVIN
jgi:hypothetical protein